jgi:hypothetical protein
MNAKLHAVLGAPRIIITFVTIGFNSEGLIAIIISVIMNSESSSSSPLLELRLLEPLASSMPWDCYHHFVKDFIGNNVRAELGRFDKPTYFGHTLLTFISIQV